MLHYCILTTHCCYFFFSFLPSYVMLFSFFINFIYRKRFIRQQGNSKLYWCTTRFGFFTFSVLELPFILSFFTFIFLRFSFCIFWDSHLVLSTNTIHIILSLLLFFFVFSSYLLFFFKKSRFLLELLTLLFFFVYWFSGTFLVNNFFSFIFFIEVISLTTFVVLLNSSFVLHKNTNVIKMDGLSLPWSTFSVKRHTFLLNVMSFFWASSLFSLLAFFILLLLSVSFNYFSFMIFKLYVFFNFYFINIYTYFIFYVFFLSFLFIKLGLVPFIFWKLQALSSTSLAFMLVYFLFYSTWLALIFYGLLLNLFVYDVVFRLVLGLFIFLLTYFFFFYIFSTQSVRFFIILSSCLSSSTLFITLFTVEGYFVSFISSIARVYYLLYIVSSFYLFIFLYQHQPVRVSLVSHFIFLNHTERNLSIYFLLTLVGIPPTSVFFFKFFILSGFFKSSIFMYILSILFFGLGIILYFGLFKSLSYSFFTLTSARRFGIFFYPGFLTWGLSLVLFFSVFLPLYLVDIIIMFSFLV